MTRQHGNRSLRDLVRRIHSALLLPWRPSARRRQDAAGKADPGENQWRSIYVNTPLPHQPSSSPTKRSTPTYATNKIRTAKYTLISFFPKSLVFQFKRIANCYFLFIIILQFIPSISEGSAKLSAISLLFIVFLSMCKDGYEDSKRSASDRDANRALTHIMGNGWVNFNKPPMSVLTPRGPLKLLFDDSGAGGSVGGGLGSGISVQQDGDSLDVWAEVEWRHIYIGDICLLRDGDAVPADMVILSSSEGNDAECYVETKNLDGETNLKLKRGLRATANLDVAQLRHLPFIVCSEGPSSNLYTYKGTFEPAPSDSSSSSSSTTTTMIPAQKEAIYVDNLLLRGSVVRNIEWVVGVVVFTGDDTKIMMNSGETPSKRSRIEKSLNFQITTQFGLLFILCFLSALLGGIYYGKDDSFQDEFVVKFQTGNSRSAPFFGFLTFWTSLILYQTIVPISLYVTIEIVKSYQAFFIASDKDMYDEKTGKRCIPKAWNLSDDLGQVEYIFSDKTGTLTQNIMEFRQCTIGGTIYGELFDEEHSAGELATARGEMETQLTRMFNNPYRDANSSFVSTTLYPDLEPEGRQSRSIIEFFTILAICHTVLAEYADIDNNPHRVEYKAQSPDEAALVAAARDVGFVFLGREQYHDNTEHSSASPKTALSCEFLGQPQKFILLNVLEFTSARKRMSVIVRRPEDNKIFMFTKGADNVIIERLRVSQDSGAVDSETWKQQRELKEKTLEDLETFATNGFRTLCLAYRVLGEDEYAAWNDEFQVACASLGDREAEIEAVCENIEHSLKLVGGSAIEDKLQVGVPETIAQLALAGVKLWVLTGDKTETAINIGYSCNLLREDMTLINIQAESAEDTENQLLRALDLYGDAAGAVYDRGAGEAKKRGGRLGKFCSRVGLGRADTESCSALIVGKNGGGRRLLPGNLSSPRPLAEEDSVSRPTGSGKGHGRPLALVIDGASLKFALEPSLSELLLALTRSCDSVICCRVSPLQKALVVKLIKDGLGCLTLAIGDGANDVSMIQTADIGIGISGEEGLQAVMASDYAISQFRFLQTLLLVHGRWSYTRISTMIVNFFYKNVVWTVGLFWYQIFCGWSVTNFYDYALINFYNMLFTSLPPGVLGVFDHDLPAYVVKTVPQLYRRGIQHLEFSTTRFWMYILDGMYQSVVIVFITAYSYQVASTAHRNGRDDASRDDIGTVAALSTVIIVNAYMGLNTRTWGLAMPAAIAIGLGCFFAIFFIYAGLSGINFSQGAARRIFTQLDTYLIILLTFVLALIPRYSTKFYKSVWRPTDADIVREIVKTKRPRRVPREQQVTMLTEYLDRISAGKVGEAGDVGAPLEGGDMAANTGPFDPEKRSPGRVEREGEARNAGPQGEDDRDHISMLRRISMMQSPHYRAQQLKRQLSRRSTGRSTTEQGMGNMPGGSSSGGVRVSRAHTHRSSIIHMGDGFAYSNTGFAYSHDDNSSLHRFGTRKGFWSRLIPKKKSHQ